MSEQEQPQTFPTVSLNLNQDSLMISIMLAPGLSLNQALGEPIMNQIVMKWLELHPQALQDVAKAALQLKQLQKNELQVIRSVKQSKVN